MARPFTIAATGDALVTMRVGWTADPGFHTLIDLLRSADVRFTNLEGTLHEFAGFPQAASGGTYVCGHPGVIDDLKGMGFNLYSAANNHMMDWGEGGLFATVETLDRRDLRRDRTPSPGRSRAAISRDARGASRATRGNEHVFSSRARRGAAPGLPGTSRCEPAQVSRNRGRRHRDARAPRRSEPAPRPGRGPRSADPPRIRAARSPRDHDPLRPKVSPGRSCGGPDRAPCRGPGGEPDLDPGRAPTSRLGRGQHPRARDARRGARAAGGVHSRVLPPGRRGRGRHRRGPRTPPPARSGGLSGEADLLQPRQLHLPKRDRAPTARRLLRAARPPADGDTRGPLRRAGRPRRLRCGSGLLGVDGTAVPVCRRGSTRRDSSLPGEPGPRVAAAAAGHAGARVWDSGPDDYRTRRTALAQVRIEWDEDGFGTVQW